MRAGSVLILASIGGVAAGSPAGMARAAGDLTIAVGECIELESAAERYACYERQVNAALTDGAEGTDAAAGTDAAEGAPSALGDGQTTVSKPSASAQPAAGVSPSAPGNDPREEEAGEIAGTIAALKEVLPNEYLITLENGQMWRQTGSKRYPLRVGHHVRIYPTHWGDSFRLTAEKSKGFIQVERAR